MRVALVAPLVLAAGCVHPCMCYELMNAAMAMVDEGRPEEAAELLGEAAAKATKHDHHDHLVFQQGLVLARAGLVEEAIALWDPLYSMTLDPDIKGRIVYEKGMLARSLGDLEEAKLQFKLLVTAHPEHGLARTGLARLSKIVLETEGDEAVLALLESLLPGALESSFGDDVLWELYAWHAQHGQIDEAKSYLLAIRYSYPYPTGERSGETLLELSRIAEDAGQYDEALGYLQEISGPMTKSPLIGSSSGGSAAEVFMRMAHIYSEHLDDPKTAIALLLDVGAMEGLETTRDDALLLASELLAALGESNKACEVLARLLEEFPYSNKRKKAIALGGDLECGLPDQDPYPDEDPPGSGSPD